MNAGYIPQDHWVHGREGGGRNLGEACHIYDLFIYLAESEIVSFSAHAINSSSKHYSSSDNFIVTITFSDGSIASLTYTSLGNKNASKESAELFVDGKVAILDDYKSLIVHGSKNTSLKTRIQNKGLLNELESFSYGIKNGFFPIPLHQQFLTCELAFAIDEMILNQ
jgi:predicted dehydrogenase